MDLASVSSSVPSSSTNSSSSTSSTSTPSPSPWMIPQLPKSTLPQEPRRVPWNTLSPEIWELIISNIQDADEIPRAWFSYRRVSRLFRRATEQAFKHGYLQRRTWIHYDLGWGHGTGDRCSLDLEMGFRRFEGERVVFCDVADGARRRELERFGMVGHQQARWESVVARDYGSGVIVGKKSGEGEGGEDGEKDIPNSPNSNSNSTSNSSSPDTAAMARLNVIEPHAIILYYLVTDVPLPGLQVDTANREVSFLWKPMLNRFFGEELLVRKLMDDDDDDEFRSATLPSCRCQRLERARMAVRQGRYARRLLLRQKQRPAVVEYQGELLLHMKQLRNLEGHRVVEGRRCHVNAVRHGAMPTYVYVSR